MPTTMVLFPQTHKSKNREQAIIYRDWLLTPKELRTPRTQRELAEQLGVSDDTLRNWRKEPQFQRDMQRAAREAIRVEKLTDVIDTLYKQATDQDNPRSVAASKLLLDFAQDAAGEPAPIDFSEMSDDQVAQLATAVLKQMMDAAQ